MKAKKQILLVVFTFSILSSWAVKKDSVSKNFVGVNVTMPILQMLARQANDTLPQSINAPLFYYGHRFKKTYLRVGLGGTNMYNETRSDIFTDRKTQMLNKFRTILGIYRQKEINSKWSVQYGINLTGVAFMNEQIFDSGFDKVNIYNRSWGGGMGPALLFQYNLTNRIKLFSEYTLLYQYIQTKSGKEFSAFPSENYSTQTSRNLGFQFNYPVSLYLTYHF